ncbi:TniQ family protein [Streptomyces olivaceus]|uniref:TniQ family protein n=1 Tax=Streptomyces olivaceus TaxID=47716 RepID=UPI001CCB6084|nr:TniQ family protein [Streptomyces olivaceus]MBZ6081338.1 TniQ family protein [Streptomyces olivaceus]
MSTWTPDRIPIAYPPLPGEALDSWISSYARRLRTTNRGFLHHIGLPAARVDHMLLRLTEPEAQALHKATGVPTAALGAMTLDAYDKFAVNIPPGRRQLERPPTWAFRSSRTRYCPACLRDQGGRGPLLWRLPWTFACMEHQLLLADFCPTCGHPPSPWKNYFKGPRDIGVCTRDQLGQAAQGGRRLCATDLLHAPAICLPPNGLVLRAQQRVAGLLAVSPAERPQALVELRQLYALAWRVLRGLRTNRDQAPDLVHTVLDECGGSLPSPFPDGSGQSAYRLSGSSGRRRREDSASLQTHHIAVGTALAQVALRGGYPEYQRLFEWILQSERLSAARDLNHGQLALRWRDSGPDLFARVMSHHDPHTLLHNRLRYSSASPAPRWPDRSRADIHRRATTIPAMLWPGWTLRLLPVDPIRSHRRVDAFRHGCSGLLLVPGGPADLPYVRAAPLLGNVRANRDRESVEQRVYRDRDLTPLASALAQLARALDEHGSPIDYARRRATFTEATVELNPDAYRRLILQHGWLAGGAHRQQVMRWYLLLLLTGHSPSPPQGAATRFAWSCTEFRFRAPLPLRAFLYEQAEQNLAAHGIDEPVTWEPPAHWVRDVDWPGIAPEQVDATALRAALGESDTIAPVTEVTGMTSEHLRLYFEVDHTVTGPPDQLLGKIRAPDPATRAAVLARSRLRELYVIERKTTAEIAGMAKCAATTVRALLALDDIPLRTLRPDTPPPPDFLRAWLYREHVEKRRPLGERARECGMSTRGLSQAQGRLPHHWPRSRRRGLRSLQR